MRGAARGEERLKLPESSAKRRRRARRRGARRAGAARGRVVPVRRGRCPLGVGRCAGPRGRAAAPRVWLRTDRRGGGARAGPPRRPTARRAAGAHMHVMPRPRPRARARGGGRRGRARGHPTAVVRRRVASLEPCSPRILTCVRYTFVFTYTLSHIHTHIHTHTHTHTTLNTQTKRSKPATHHGRLCGLSSSRILSPLSTSCPRLPPVAAAGRGPTNQPRRREGCMASARGAQRLCRSVPSGK
jgi:hypothetical protein